MPPENSSDGQLSLSQFLGTIRIIVSLEWGPNSPLKQNMAIGAGVA